MGGILGFAWKATVVIFVGSACARHDAPEKQGARSELATTVQEYPPGIWRLASFDELDRSVVWVSHIVVRDRESDGAWFRPLTWAPDPVAPNRSASEALAIASEVQRLATSNPGHFPKLASVYSDDVVSKNRGGSLGGNRTSQIPAEFLDALATLRPGEVSQVVRTPFGFHVLRRDIVPPDEVVAAQRISIGYVGTLGTPAGVLPIRGKDEAERLAHKVVETARSGTIPFETLVAQYSDTQDKVEHGNLGAWSLRDPGYLPTETEQVALLRVGEISEPLDSRFGFEVLKRIVPTQSDEFAMTAIELLFNVEGPDTDPGSRTSIQVKTQEIAGHLAKDPGHFEDFQHEYCCLRTQRWTEGRGPVGVTAALKALQYGEIAKSPILFDRFFLIPKRLDPALLPTASAISWEIPSPSRPNYEAIVRDNKGPTLASLARDLAREMSRTSLFDEKQRGGALRVLEAIAASLEDVPGYDQDMKQRRIQAGLAMLRAELGDERFREFEIFANTWAIRGLMGG